MKWKNKFSSHAVASRPPWASCCAVRARRREGFLLLEVLVALAILGSALAVLMSGFSSAMRNINQNNYVTTGMLLAQRLLDEYEFDPPATGSENGHFGEAFPEYTWEREVYTEAVQYRTAQAASTSSPEEMAEMIMVRLVIYYEPVGKARSVAFDITTALTQAERFNQQSRLRNGIYPNDKNNVGGRGRR